MANISQIDEDKLIDERDIEGLNAQRDPERREAMFCALSTYRRPDRLFVGDPVPYLELVHLGTGEKASLRPTHGQPLVLFFGSYT